ncbi:MAG TPA: hypothetical protein VFT41_11455 [Gemmatimonadaceae bacterium]|nr:hypothetical protein [Gemmatimonadaceae bacterium]
MHKGFFVGALALAVAVSASGVQAQTGGNCSNCTGVNVTSSTVTGGVFVPVNGIGTYIISGAIQSANSDLNASPTAKSVFENGGPAAPLGASFGASFTDGASNPAVQALVQALDALKTNYSTATVDNAIDAFNQMVQAANSVSLFSNSDFKAVHAVLAAIANSLPKASS